MRSSGLSLNQLRNNIAHYYKTNIDGSLSIPFTPKGYFSSWAQFSLIPKNGKTREDFMRSFRKKDIPTMIYYKKPLHLQDAFKNLEYEKGSFPVSEKVSDEIFSIPMHPYLQPIDQDKIIEILNNE